MNYVISKERSKSHVSIFVHIWKNNNQMKKYNKIHIQWCGPPNHVSAIYVYAIYVYMHIIMYKHALII